jgi:hypothetical protein
MEKTDKQNGIRSRCQLVQKYMTYGNRNFSIKTLERSVINSVLHLSYRAGLVKWIQDYEDTPKELALIGKKTWNDGEMQRRWFVQNAQSISLVDTGFGRTS